MMKRNALGGACMLAVWIGSMGLATLAYAQAPSAEPESPAVGLEEVVVTARKREESLQEVPLAVTAFSAEQIAREGIKDIEDAIESDPSLNFDTGFAPYDTRIVIRGLSPTRGRPNVATLVDGVDVSSEAVGVAGGSLLINPKLLDVERIEVVKGPQSALYGRSAFAGAVQYVTKDPADEFEATLGGEFGNFANSEFRFDLSAPIIEDELGFRLTALKYSKDGAYRNLITGAEVGGSEGEGVALTTKWDFTENVHAKFRYEYSHDAFEQSPQAFLPYNTVNVVPASASQCNGGPIRDGRCLQIPAAVAPLPGVSNNLAYVLENLTGNRGFFTDHSVPAFRGSLGDADGRSVIFSPDFASSTDGGRTGPDYPGSDRNVNRASLVLDWDVSFGRFSSLTGYTDADVYTAIDLDKFAQRDPATGRDVSGVEQNLTTRGETWQNSQELRFTSDFDGPLNFIAGLQYWKEKTRQVEDNFTAIAQGERCQTTTSIASGTNGAVTPLFPGGMVPAYVEIFPGSCGGGTQLVGFRSTATNPMSPVFAVNGANVFSSVTALGGVGQFVDDIVAAKDSTFVERLVEHQSAYLQFTWDITDSLSASVEARYVDEDNTLTGADPIENTAPPPAGFGEGLGAGPGTVTLCGPNGPCIPRTGTGPTAVGVPNGPRAFGPVRPVQYLTFKRNDSYVTPRVSLDWRINSDVLVYASYGAGQKPGGFSTVTIGAFGIDANADRLPNDIEFKPEKLKEYELGFKSSWLNRRLIVNGAVFLEDFTDKQISAQQVIGTTLGNVITNIDGGEIRGLELAMQWQALEKLRLAAGYTYLDSEYTGYVTTTTGAPEIGRVQNCEPGYLDNTETFVPATLATLPAAFAARFTCRVSRNGNQFEDTPEHALVAQATWRDRFGDSGVEWFADLSARYQSKRFIEDDNVAWVDSYWLADFRFGLEGKHWSAVAFVDNLLNDDTIRNGSTGPGNANANFRFGQLTGATSPAAGGISPAPVAAPLIPTLTFANLPDPRTYGLRVAYKFSGGGE